MTFADDLGDGTWLTEHVNEPSAATHDVGDHPPRAPAAHAVRVVWDVEVRVGQIIVTPERIDRMNPDTKAGRRPQTWRDGTIPDRHIKEIRRKVAQSHRVAPDRVVVSDVPNAHHRGRVRGPNRVEPSEVSRR